MKSCAFFGHRNYDYAAYSSKIEEIAEELIVKSDVKQFYCGGRGKFDLIGAKTVKKLKIKYPQIIITQVLSYIPKEKEDFLSTYFDDSVYLLERNVPKRFAILETNKLLVEKVDFVISGVEHNFGGAAQAVEYAQRKQKDIINIFT